MLPGSPVDGRVQFLLSSRGGLDLLARATCLTGRALVQNQRMGKSPHNPLDDVPPNALWVPIPLDELFRVGDLAAPSVSDEKHDPRTPSTPPDVEVSLSDWTSRVRGLMLGIALGDAVGGAGPEARLSGPLAAGAATELAAWTVEGLLRDFTANNWAITARSDGVLHAYQRWAMLRGAHSAIDSWDPTPLVEGEPSIGWLMRTPEARRAHGSSPTMIEVAVTGKACRTPSSRAVIKALPYAALAGAGQFSTSGPSKIAAYAGMFTEQTHTNTHATGSATIATFVLANLLRASESFETTMQRCATSLQSIAGYTSLQGFAMGAVKDAISTGLARPRQARELQRLAPDADARSALLGGLYVATSFASAGEMDDALRFTSMAPDSRSIASVAMAVLGARHGYESLPQEPTNRLEFGWIMDRLGTDLALRVVEGSLKGPSSLKWKVKYPA